MSEKENLINEKEQEREFFKDFIRSQASIALEKFVREKKAFNYKYTPLEGILPVVLKILSENNIGLSQNITLNEDKIVCETILFHTNGFSKCYVATAPFITAGINEKTNIMQMFGAFSTYLRRYMLISIFGIATEDEDTDAEIPLKPQYQQSKPQPQPQQPPTIPIIQHTKESLEQVFQPLNLKVKVEGNIATIIGDYNATTKNKALIQKMGFVWYAPNKAWCAQIAG
ncbi:MAG: ERF family protein [Thermoplasmata archaeon]